MARGKISAAVGNARSAYALELARGRSYIGSTLTPATRSNAITEVFAEFVELYGDRELALFQKLLAEDLQRQGQPDASLAVLEFKFRIR
ncbi:hypothetical protein [Paraburkholderia sp. RL17-381-BIF-C]|jgi:hypothetical protein|uniref:hypothetical protein n=1 Tax=Paraburkholderia sp. RL17-381-BIF-C TaxID=3031635 RepID=UPI0038BA48B9